MTIGVFGGSFDPPHICHVLVCQYVLCMDQVQRVLVIPSYKHPFDKVQSPYEDRLRMCQLAMAPLGERVEVSDLESRREAYSYTVDTLRELHRLHPGEPFRLIIGSDILPETERWHEFEEVKRLAPLLIVPRGVPAGETEGLFAFPPLSSTDVRKAMQEGRDVAQSIPPAVREWIRRKNLYEAKSETDNGQRTTDNGQ